MNDSIQLTPRQEQAILTLSQNKYSLLYGGSRSGKTFIIIFFILWRAMKCKSRHLIVRLRFAHVKQSVVYDTFPKVCDLFKIKYVLNKSDWFATLPNGSEIWFGGLDDKDRTDKILGNEYSTIFENEASQISYNSHLILLTRLSEKTKLKNRLFQDQNPPSKAHWTYKIYFKNIEPQTNTQIKTPGQYGFLKMSPHENVQNISDDYIEILQSLPKAQRKRFYDGDFAEIIKGALWSDEMINRHRVQASPENLEVVVAVDPATTAKMTSDETGITVTGKDKQGHGYLLEDLSGIYSPDEWAKIAVNLYIKHQAKYIIAESNQGGDMVSHTIKSVNRNIPVKLVHATKGKIIRAEPISALYEQGKIHHLGYFPDLEEEQVTYTGQPGDKSPNRLDSLVWGFSYLFPIGGGSGIYRIS